MAKGLFEVLLLFILYYFAARPGFQGPAGSASSAKKFLEPVPITEKGQLPTDYVLEDPDSHYIYICKKIDEPIDVNVFL